MMRNLFRLLVFALIPLISCTKDVPADPNQSLIGQMKAVTDSIIQNTQVPGIVALVADHKRGIDWLYTAGYSDIPNKLPMDGSYTFRIGSITKTMTVTVLLQLVDEGKLSLNDPLAKFFPDLPNSGSITIAMLCNMTSGIPDYVKNPDFFPVLNSFPEKVWLPAELVEMGIWQGSSFSPGTGWEYSNTNTIIVGQIIEHLTGNSLDQEIQNRIILPLNLTHTGFLTSGLSFPGPHGRGYYYGTFLENQDLTEHFDISWGWAAGSAYSTPEELQKYVEVLVKGGFLSDSLQQWRLNDLHLTEIGDYYASGLVKRGSFYGHHGSVMSFTSAMFHSIEKDCTIIIYFNCLLEIRPDYLFYRFTDILYGNDD